MGQQPEQTEDSLPRYHLVRTIASGGMAQIYEATFAGQRGFKRRVALKRILPQHADDPAMRRMFFDEARVAAQLHHGNIVQILDYGTVDGGEFIAMEYVDGVDAWRAVRRSDDGSAMPEGVALHVIAEIAHALHYAHTLSDEQGQPLGIVHRDVSPQNILLSWEGDVKLSDFGIALALEREEKTRTGIVKGKASYMAPEQAIGFRVTTAADVYALGTTLWALLKGSKTLDQRLRHCSEETATEVERWMSDDPAARPSAREVAEACGRHATRLLARGPRDALRGWLEPLRERSGRRSALDDVLGLSLVLVGDRQFTVTGDRRKTVVDRPRSPESDEAVHEHTPTSPRTTAMFDERTAREHARPKRSRRILMALLALIAAGIAGAALWAVYPAAEYRSIVHTATPDTWPRSVLGDPSRRPPREASVVHSDARAAARTDSASLHRQDSKPRARVRQKKRAIKRAARRRKEERRSTRRDVPKPAPVGHGWLRVGGAKLGGGKVEVNGVAMGYVPLEQRLSAGRHVLVVRENASGDVLLKQSIVIGVHHTRTSPKRIIR